MKSLIVGLVAISFAAQPALATSFNLRCTGTVTFGGLMNMAEITKNSRPIVQILRVDLASQRWCMGDCKQTDPIYRISDTEIIFKFENEKDSETIVKVNRESGEYLNRFRDLHAKLVSMSFGTCEREEFGGFPAKKF